MLYVEQAASRYPESSPGLEDAFTESIFIPKLTLPLCLHGMKDVVKAVDKLQGYTKSEKISTTSPEQTRQLILTIANDVLRPVAGFLWCHLVSNDDNQLEKEPRCLSLCLKDLEANLAGPIVDNMWLLYRACENAVSENEASTLDETLMIAIERVKVLFQNVESVMSSGCGFQFFGKMADNHIEDEEQSSFSLNPKTITMQPQSNSFDWHGLKKTYSLFGGKSAWSFNETESSFLSTKEEFKSLKITSEDRARSFSDAKTSQLNFSSTFQDDRTSLAVGHGYSSASWLPPNSNALSRSLTVPTVSCLSAQECKSDGAHNRPFSSSFSSGSTGNFSCSTETDAYTHLASALGCLDLGSAGDEDKDWQKPPVRYKTAMCKRVLDGRKCRYSKACGFAHSEMEKDRYASLHLATVRCTFGSRCRNVCCGRAHGAQEQLLAIKIYNNAVERGRGNMPRPVYK